MTEESNMPPAGWYDDGTGRPRWFDGAMWGPYADPAVVAEALAPAEATDPVEVTDHAETTTPAEVAVYAETATPAEVAAYADTTAYAGTADYRVDVEPVIVRRTRRTQILPPLDEQESEVSGITVSRDWGLGLRSANSKKDSGLPRNRKIAGDLPDWAPLPPGELSVDRNSRRHR